MRSTILRLSVVTVAAALAASNAIAAGPPAGADVRLTIARDHYAVAGAQFGDLADVEHWVRAGGRQVVAIDGCAVRAEASLLAAVERFYPRSRSALEIRALPAGAPDCAPVPAAMLMGRSAVDEYLATDAHGRSLLP